MRRALAVAFVLLAVLVAAGPVDAEEPAMPAPDTTRVLLVGASIGEAWDFPHLPRRAGLDGVICEYAGLFRFDKSDSVESALARGAGRPDVVILKECAAYFPGDLPCYESLVRGWVGACRAVGVLPVLATVAPVVEERTPLARLKRLVKQQILRRPDRNPAIAAYNDWVRGFAREEGLEVLDIEAALRVSAEDRTLRADLADADGLHVNGRAYALLDIAAADLLRRVAARRDGPAAGVTG